MPKFFKLISIGLIIVGLSSCYGQEQGSRPWVKFFKDQLGTTKPEAKKQVPEQFQIPENELIEPLALSGGRQPAISYSGTLLFWDSESVRPEQIAAISNATVASRFKKSAFIDLVLNLIPDLRMQLALKEEAFSSVVKEIESARQNANPEQVRAAMQEFVDSWFSDRLSLAEEQKVLTPEDRGDVERQFTRYCEFKLWELATSPLLLQKFRHRPTPLSLCEPYFSQKGYFSTDASSSLTCETAKVTKDWFDCIWKDGVLKSSMLTQLSQHEAQMNDCAKSGSARVLAISSWLTPEADGTSLMRKIVAEPRKFQNKSLANMVILDGYPSLKLLLSSSAGRSFREAFPYMSRFKECPEAFAVKGQRGGDIVAEAIKLNARDEASTHAVTLSELRNIGENLVPSQSEEALFPATSGNGEQSSIFLKLVVAPLTAYSERLSSNLSGDIRASYDDYAMNELMSGPIPLPETHNGLLAIEGRVEANNQKAAFDGLRRVEDRILKRDYGYLLEAREVREAELKEAKQALSEATDQISARIVEVQDENVSGTIAATDPGATTFFQSLRLDLAAEDGKLLVELKIAEGEVIRGCSDFYQIVECPSSFEAKDSKFKVLAFDGESGKLTLEVSLESPQAIGFGPVPRGVGPEKFNEILTEVIEQGSLKLEVYANRLGENFKFISGKAFLLDQDAKTLFEGSFSADTYPMEKAKLGL